MRASPSPRVKSLLRGKSASKDPPAGPPLLSHDDVRCCHLLESQGVGREADPVHSGACGYSKNILTLTVTRTLP